MQSTNDVFQRLNFTGLVPSTQLRAKLQKTSEITYLEVNKQQTKGNIYCLTRGFGVRTKLRLMF